MTLDRITMMNVRNLRPNKRNARTHSKKQIHQIANSILRFNWTYPILVDDNGQIICGHGRWQAAIQLGLNKVPVIVMSDLSDAAKRALALADNKIAANSGWDRAVLAAELGELATLLPECSLDLEITGFEPAEIDALLGDLVDRERDDADDIPHIEQIPVSRKDDYWALGENRLLCGDATNVAQLGALMGRNRAAMVFADPPYNVRIASVQGRGKIKHREFASASGEMSRDEFTSFLTRTFSLAAQYSREGSIHYVCMDWRHLGEAMAAGNEVYTEFKNLVVWAKTNAGQGSFYRSQHELILVFKNGEGPHQNNIELGRHGRNRSNVWTYAGVNTFRTGHLDDLSVHPTVKPVSLVADAMRDCSSRGDIILDPFIGSGTTILAAERVGRRAYGVEIDPLYVDAAIRRWQNFTRRDAVLKATGQTFHEVAATRPSAKRVRAK
ncbi:DNA methyltransferase [Bradyrhizobium sp. JYMT SZCCT0428]|uniref:site-specific DNA-methyltransferase n=1 Tax=Bradyrhizobium sp. JYMT SZCCT0428 TaxID=2807673 RepID=UPI001BAB3421|nr:DNA methyltransferase [Bradyrhizobium sp. JYMT SZCCT0428]MBR1153974.1 ParB N-terminal domain-containing protein [Bradyrhizobium sp. JYMT SZCCT0428]